MIQLQNGRSLNLPYIEAFKLLKFSDWNVENRQNVILRNADYLYKRIKAEVLSGKHFRGGTQCNNKRCKYMCNLRMRSWVDDLKCLKIGPKCQFQPNLA